MEFSKYQLDVFDYWKKRSGHNAVISVAGSGKTTTAIEGVGNISNYYSKLMASFNKEIQIDFEAKGRAKGYTNITYKTFNAFGFGICRQNIRNMGEPDALKTEKILKSIMGGENTKLFYKFKGAVTRLVGLFKNLNIHTEDEALNRLGEITDYYDIDTPDHKDFTSILIETFRACINTTHMLDWDDQKYMPIHHGWNIPTFDNVIIDECQDIAELEWQLLKAAAEGGLLSLIGDPDQSIYSFKGTSPDSMTRFIAEIGAKELPLSICYRCPINVINEAKKIVPRIESAPGAIEGTVDTLEKKKFYDTVQEGDFVLCRVNQHLVKECLHEIKAGKKAKVRGRDFGDKCLYLIDKVSNNQDTMSAKMFWDTLSNYNMKKQSELKNLGREREALTLSDKVETVNVLLEECNDIRDLKKKIDFVFINDKQRNDGIDFLSIHRSKGLQQRRVFIIRKDLLPHPKAQQKHQLEEEKRLEYVAVTRSSESLFYVNKDKGER